MPAEILMVGEGFDLLDLFWAFWRPLYLKNQKGILFLNLNFLGNVVLHLFDVFVLAVGIAINPVCWQSLSTHRAWQRCALCNSADSQSSQKSAFPLGGGAMTQVGISPNIALIARALLSRSKRRRRSGS